MVIGFIVSDKRLRGIDPLFRQVTQIGDAESNRPILIVGLDNAKKDSRYKSILEKELGDGVFWTFSKTESRADFEDDLEAFYKYAYDNLLSNIEYHYLDVTKIDMGKAKFFLAYLNSRERKTIYMSGGMMYVTFGTNAVIGVSLTVLDYCRIHYKDTLSRVLLNNANEKVDEDWKSEKLTNSRLDGKAYAVPLIARK